jgi:hypothetical protein
MKRRGGNTYSKYLKDESLMSLRYLMRIIFLSVFKDGFPPPFEGQISLVETYLKHPEVENHGVEINLSM